MNSEHLRGNSEHLGEGFEHLESSGISGELATHKDSSYVRRVPVECYTRIVGYFRPKSEANKGKREEINDRRLFDANKYLKGETSCSHGLHNCPPASSMDASA